MNKNNLSLWFPIRPSLDMAEVSHLGNKSTYVNVTFKSKMVIQNIHGKELITDFFRGIRKEWVEFVIENSNSFILDEEFVLYLN